MTPGDAAAMMKKSESAAVGETSQELAKTYNFDVIGKNNRGFYQLIQGEFEGKSISLKGIMKKEFIDLGGGLSSETVPSFNIKGDFAGMNVDLNVKSQIIENTDGIQTGLLSLVDGKIGDREIKLGVVRDNDLGTTKLVKGPKGSLPNITLDREDIVEGVVLKGHSWIAKGEDVSGKLDARFTENKRTGNLTVEGDIPKDTLAMLIALEPYTVA
jgi:hypothetical protein